MAADRIVLVNLGTPSAATPEAVEVFLREFLGDPMVVDYPRWFWRPILEGMILRKRPARVAVMYRSIWTDEGSPLYAGTVRIAEGVARLVDGRAKVDVAFRYGTLGLRNVLVDSDDVAGAVNRETVVLPLFPQRTGSSSGTVVALVDEMTRSGRIDGVRSAALAPDASGYIEAVGARVREAVDRAGTEPEHLVVSFHGIPKRYDRKEGGVYQADCRATTEALLSHLGWPTERATLCYQSRFGPEPWLLPSTAQVLPQLAARGVKSVAVVTPGFLTDGLETLEEIGIRGREAFLAAGGATFVHVLAPAGHVALDRALALACGLHV